MGLHQTMNIAVRGMSASQLGLDVTAQNISNVNTEGYSRKKLTLTADSRDDTAFGQMGFGVEVKNIARIRDVFVDKQIMQQIETKGYYDQIDNALERIENIFTEPQDMGLANYVEEFWDAWQDLVNNPGDYGSRSVVKAKGQVLTDVFHNLAGEFNGLQDSQNSAIEEKVKRINEILKEVHNLNKEVTMIESTGQNANDSRDQRDLLVKELSKYVDTASFEDENGALTITSAGYLMVSPVTFSKIELSKSTFRNSDGTSRSDLSLSIGASRKDYKPLDGELKGLFKVRDEVVPFFKDILDELSTNIVEKVNELHTKGYSLDGFSGIHFFDPQKTKAGNINLSAAVLQDVKNIAAASGGTASNIITHTLAVTNIGSTVPPASTAYGTPVNLSNDLNPTTTYDNIIQGTVTVTTTVAGNTVTLEEGGGKDYIIDYANGTITFLSSASLKLGDPNTNPIEINYQYNTGASKGPGDGSNALAIAQLRQTKTMEVNPAGENTATFSEYYSGIIGTLGIQRNEATANVESRSTMIRYLEKQQDAYSGVSLDEEMTNLIKFEHSFAAAARLISVVEDMMDTLIRM